MTDEAPHPVGPRTGAGATLMRLLAGLLVLYAAVIVALFLPFTLLITAMEGSRAPGIESWMIYLWCLFAFVASIWVIITGVGAIEAPRLGRIFALLGVAAAVFFAFPPFWAVPE